MKGDTPVALVDQIDFVNRIGYTPCTLNGATNPAIFSNNLTSFDGVMAPSGDGVYLALELSDSTVAEYDATANAWVAARKDFSGLLGSYGAINDQLWNAGPNLLDGALVPVGTPFPATEGTASGVANFNGIGLRSSSTAATDPGLLQLINTISLSEFDADADRGSSGHAGQPGPQRPYRTDRPHDSFVHAVAGPLAGSIDHLRAHDFGPHDSAGQLLESAGPRRSSTRSSARPTACRRPPPAAWYRSGAATSAATSQGSGFPLATSLGNACVTANGEELPLYYASPSLINAQIPYDIVGGTSVVVQSPTGISAPFSLQVQPDGHPPCS